MVGSQLGSYRLIRQLGDGGMGTVYEGLNEAIERHVAIKVLHPAFARDPEAVTRFVNEARAVNRIEHPSLVQIHEHNRLPDGMTYIVMELLQGETLAQRLSRLKGPLSASVASHIAWQVATALSAAHAKQIVHRDLKPSNLMLVPDPLGPDGERVKILDFGIAKLQTAHRDHVTADRAVMGTPLYMSPEQCEEAGSVDGKSDVYSLGCILFEMLALRPPFVASENSSVFALLKQHQESQPPLLRTLNPSIATETEALVTRMLSKSAQRRPSMKEVAESLSSNPGVTPRSYSRTNSPTTDDEPIGLARTIAAAEPPSNTTERGMSRRVWPVAGLLICSMVLGGLLASSVKNREEYQRQGPSNTDARSPQLAVVPPRTDLGVASLPLIQPLTVEADAAPCKQLFSSEKGQQVCPQNHTAWCSKDGSQLACCVQGTVPFGREGSCGCAPGNVRAEDKLAIQRGCIMATESDVQHAQSRSKVVFKHIKQLKQCMEPNLDDDDRTSGTTLIKLLLGPTGHVLSARISATSIPAPPISQCLLSLFRTIEFPPPPSGWEEFTYPVQILSSDESQKAESQELFRAKAK